MTTLYLGTGLEVALAVGHDHIAAEFYNAYAITFSDGAYTVEDANGLAPYDRDSVPWTYSEGLDAPEFDECSRLLESCESLETPAHYLYHLPTLADLEDGQTAIVFPYIAFHADMERDEDGNTIDEDGELADDLVGHGIALTLNY